MFTKKLWCYLRYTSCKAYYTYYNWVTVSKTWGLVFVSGYLNPTLDPSRNNCVQASKLNKLCPLQCTPMQIPSPVHFPRSCTQVSTTILQKSDRKQSTNRSTFVYIQDFFPFSSVQQSASRTVWQWSRTTGNTIHNAMYTVCVYVHILAILPIPGQNDPHTWFRPMARVALRHDLFRVEQRV